MKDDCPCHGCTERVADPPCHSTCKRWKDWRAEEDRKKALRQEKREADEVKYARMDRYDNTTYVYRKQNRSMGRG